MGWPYTYWDGKQKIRLMAPEYGGNNKTQPPTGMYVTPVADFWPSHAPLDLVFYQGKQFPAHYRGGAFLVMHGGNGGHSAPGGYEVDYVPFGERQGGNAGSVRRWLCRTAWGRGGQESQGCDLSSGGGRGGAGWFALYQRLPEGPHLAHFL